MNSVIELYKELRPNGVRVKTSTDEEWDKEQEIITEVVTNASDEELDEFLHWEDKDND